MKNISFDNPYLLLLIIPIALAIVIPYVISISRDNKTIGWKISLALHLVIGVIVTLAIAGIMSVTVLTQTTVYVLADVSYSSEGSLDEIDEHIAKISESLPTNSKLGVVCFGRNVEQLTPVGRAIKSVKNSKVDKSATDIVSALKYTESLFGTDTIKRIVLITDGNDTLTKDASSLAAAVDQLVANGVKIDTIFINNTLDESDSELQLSGVNYTKSTYIGHKSEAKFLVQASTDMNVMLDLYKKVGDELEQVGYTVSSIQSGLSTITMALDTKTSGEVEYVARISTESEGGDFSPHNNEITFMQTVEGKLQVLLVTGQTSDVDVIEAMYGDSADIDARVIGKGNSSVPFTIEALSKYDEILLSNVDVRDISHAGAFISSLDIVVSQYGKSLITLGDLKIQEEADEYLFNRLEELLPVSYGNSNRDGRLYTIVFDISGSMGYASKLSLLQDATCELISMLSDDDMLCFITFSGKVTVTPARLVGECKQDVMETVRSYRASDTEHGTDIGLGLEEALNVINLLGYESNQVVLLSDGKSFASKKGAAECADELRASGATLSVIHAMAANPDNKELTADYIDGHDTMVAVAADGPFYEIFTGSGNTNDVTFGDVSSDITEAVIRQNSTVNIVKYKDPITNGFSSVPNVSGYIQSLAKFDATVPLTISYEKRENHIVQVPLYAYRAHGNGRVCTLTTSLSDGFTSLWSDEFKEDFITNMLVSNTPDEKVDYPFTVKLERDDYEAYFEIIPSVLNPDAIVKVKVTTPNGEPIERELTFDSQKYFMSFDTIDKGTYRIDITYSYDDYVGDNAFTASVSFDISYLTEYNAFTSFDKTKVYSFMHGNGQITEDEIPSLENDESEVSTYKVKYTVPLLIAAIVLFVADIIIRKWRINKRLGDKKAKKEKKVKVKRTKGEAA